MITVKIFGGMGNQLWQRAYGLALESRGYDVVFDKSWFSEEEARRYSFFEYSLGIFGDLKFGAMQERFIHECDLTHYDSRMLQPPDGSTLVGYWQSEHYFEDISDKVRRAFTFPALSFRYAALHQDISSSNSVSVHIRRKGFIDFLEFHGVLAVDYYTAAIERIRAANDDAQFYVFADASDRPWCREFLPKDLRIVDGTDKYEDMYLTAACKHAITANSSFSFWGAWLGDEKPNRIVIAPKKMFTAPTMANDADMVPARWIRL